MQRWLYGIWGSIVFKYETPSNFQFHFKTWTNFNKTKQKHQNKTIQKVVHKPSQDNSNNNDSKMMKMKIFFLLTVYHLQHKIYFEYNKVIIFFVCCVPSVCWLLIFFLFLLFLVVMCFGSMEKRTWEYESGSTLFDVLL